MAVLPTAATTNNPWAGSAAPGVGPATAAPTIAQPAISAWLANQPWTQALMSHMANNPVAPAAPPPPPQIAQTPPTPLGSPPPELLDVIKRIKDNMPQRFGSFMQMPWGHHFAGWGGARTPPLAPPAPQYPTPQHNAVIPNPTPVGF
jgi:hypothetical protein